MAYTRENWLKRAKDIQDVYKKHSQKFDGESTNKWIYENIIEPRFHMSKASFYEYLGEPRVEQQLSRYAEARESQQSLF